MGKLYKSKCYCTNLRRSAAAITDYYDKAFEGIGLTVPQFYLIRNLNRLGQANITEWAEHVGIERTTMVRNVRVLEQRGWLTRADGRGKQFKLSTEGEKILKEAVPLWEQSQKKMRDFIGEEDAQAIMRIADKLQDREFDEIV